MGLRQLLRSNAEGAKWLHIRMVLGLSDLGKPSGLPSEELGAQSGRIRGATDLFAVEANPAVLQVAGRWVSRGRDSNASQAGGDLHTCGLRPVRLRPRERLRP